MKPRLCILLATRNGADFLPAQLQSIAAQRGVAWRLCAADDGSCDGTRAVLADFAARHPSRVTLLDGPRRGAAANFLHLLRQTRTGEAVAFADQDDVWLPDKLQQACLWFKAQGAMDAAGAEAAVAAWSCRTVVTDAALRPVSLGPAPRRPDFANALVQNILAGNALVLSPAAAALMRAALPGALAHGVTAHDWWCYQLVTGAGGKVFIDPVPHVLYRQHGRNAEGHRAGLRAHLARARALWRGDFGPRIAAHLAALMAHADLLQPSAQARLSAFAAGDWRVVHRHIWYDDHALRFCARLGRINLARSAASVPDRLQPAIPAAPSGRDR